MGPLNCFYYFRLQRGHHDERNLEICHHKRTSSNILCLNAFFIPLLHLTNKVSTMMNCEYYSKILLGIFNKFERGLFSQIFWGWMGVEQLVWFPFNDGHFVVPRWTFFFIKSFSFLYEVLLLKVGHSYRKSMNWARQKVASAGNFWKCAKSLH